MSDDRPRAIRPSELAAGLCEDAGCPKAPCSKHRRLAAGLLVDAPIGRLDTTKAERDRRFREQHRAELATGARLRRRATGLLPTAPKLDGDPVEDYARLIGKMPSAGAIRWIDRMARDHGGEATGRAIAAAMLDDDDTSTVLGRADTALKLAARGKTVADDAARAEAAERRRAAAEARERSATPEERARAELVKRAIRVSLATGARVPDDHGELEAWLAEHEPKQPPAGRRAGKPERIGELVQGAVA